MSRTKHSYLDSIKLSPLDRVVVDLGFLTSEARPPQDISDPVGVSLVSLAPPEPPPQEDVKDPEPPPPETKPDFEPDLVQPSVLGAGAVDFAVKIDLGEVGGIPYMAMEFIAGESLEVAVGRRDETHVELFGVLDDLQQMLVVVDPRDGQQSNLRRFLVTRHFD